MSFAHGPDDAFRWGANTPTAIQLVGWVRARPGELTRADLAALLGKHRTTISRALERLFEDGIVYEQADRLFPGDGNFITSALRRGTYARRARQVWRHATQRRNKLYRRHEQRRPDERYRREKPDDFAIGEALRADRADPGWVQAEVETQWNALRGLTSLFFLDPHRVLWRSRVRTRQGHDRHERPRGPRGDDQRGAEQANPTWPPRTYADLTEHGRVLSEQTGSQPPTVVPPRP